MTTAFGQPKAAFCILMMLLLLSGCTTVPRSYSPAMPVDPRAFSHAALQDVLNAHVKDGVVQYPAIAHEPNFARYLDELDRVAPNRLPTPNHRLAFWINAYNAFAIKGILDGFSPSTFTGRYTYFVSQEYRVGGETINLYDLERKLLIADFREPRIHFAIVCASQSCPQLREWAYSPDQLDQQLDDSARRFINDPSRNRFDRERRIAYLSKIFDWFTEDFVNHSGSLTNYVAQYIDDPELAHDLLTYPYGVEFLEYDWNLNGPSP